MVNVSYSLSKEAMRDEIRKLSNVDTCEVKDGAGCVHGALFQGTFTTKNGKEKYFSVEYDMSKLTPGDITEALRDIGESIQLASS